MGILHEVGRTGLDSDGTVAFRWEELHLGLVRRVSGLLRAARLPARCRSFARPEGWRPLCGLTPSAHRAAQQSRHSPQGPAPRAPDDVHDKKQPQASHDKRVHNQRTHRGRLALE